MSFKHRALVLIAALTASTALAGIAPSPAQAATKDPVIVVAGTFSPAFANEALAARLRSDGYRTYIFELPGLGTGDINASSQALNTFADSVRAQTGAAKVDLVGHSQGGLVARGYVKSYGGASEVDSLVMLGTPNKGTQLANLANWGLFGNCLGIVGCQQMMQGSTYLNNLNAGDDTIGSVRYTAIRTRFDEIVFPVDNAKLGDGATNVRIQDRCWARVVGHLGLIIDGTVYSGVRQALEGRTSIRLNCWAI